MTTTINLNADIGEGFGAYKIIPRRAHTPCVHRGEPTGVAAAARAALEPTGIKVVTLPEMTFE
jgi:lactam utilization protein B